MGTRSPRKRGDSGAGGVRGHFSEAQHPPGVITEILPMDGQARRMGDAKQVPSPMSEGFVMQLRQLRVVPLTALGLFACSSADRPPGAPINDGISAIPGGKDQGTFTVVFASRLEPAGAHCEAGGIALLSGADKNRNGVLDAGEVTSTQYICNGQPGATGPAGPQGPTGAPGAAGTDGKNSLVAVTDEPSGGACVVGGEKVTVGLDANDNGI